MKNGLFIFNDDKMWYLNDVLHRTDGPAVEDNNGGMYTANYIGLIIQLLNP
jgi:hypothetical protein